MAKIVVGLSGGVDSSVAAYLLKEAGHEVIGMFMRNWHDESVTISDDCPWVEDSNDALLVADKLGIPFQVIDLSESYKARIVDYMFKEYEIGRTPNPDVLCNREIKFDVFLKAAMKLGADYVATGHYCQKEEFDLDGKKMAKLIGGADPNKDQSYFLCQISQAQLQKAIFPIGHLLKSEVRAIALEQDLVTAEKKDSQGLCFIGKVKLPVFLQQQLAPKKGQVIEVPDTWVDYSLEKPSDLEQLVKPFHYTAQDGKVVGEHQGAHYFTIGQRKGLNIGGNAEPLFVIATDTADNLIYTGQGDTHPGLYRHGLFIHKDELHWLRTDLALKVGESNSYEVRIRYRQALVSAELKMKENGLYVLFNQAQKAVAAGQFCAWYQDNELIGSGVIDS